MATEEATLTLERAMSICRANWDLYGISTRARADMEAELREHLREAVARGRSVEAVVGTDPAAFAMDWARARASRPERWTRMATNMGAFAGLILLFRHLVLRSTEVPVTAGHLALTGLILILLWTAESRRGALGFWRFQLLCAAFVIPPAIAIGMLVEGTLFQVPLWASVGALLPTLVWSAWEKRGRHGASAGAQS
ncbi:hypothetical protein [Embleya sp. NBC_00896]|uniref:hypothetical protein n=1 Tax=Embleya sp. NBC_00896 TaxID=2975961 RepID=UPI002F90E66A|nr:DUF1048 domain-containing protein [Embleya sp. NBC_00896]